MEITQHLQEPMYTIEVTHSELRIIDDILLKYAIANSIEPEREWGKILSAFRDHAAPYLR